MVRADLVAFLREAAAREFILGEFDCGLWLADWYMRATGRPDPAAPWRGTYQDEAGYRALRFPLVIARAFDRAGVPRTKRPETGDVAVLRGKRDAVGAIRTDSGWAFLAVGRKGLGHVTTARVMAAWKV